MEEREIVMIERKDRQSLMTHFEESIIENEMYRAYADGLGLGMMVLENHGGKLAVIRYTSDQATRILHCTSKDLVGRELFQMIHPKDERLLLDMYTESQEGRSMMLRESIIALSPDGDSIYLEGCLGPIKYKGGRCSYFLFNDNTSRILLLNELRQFAIMFNAINMMVLLTNWDFKIKYINPRAIEWFGYEFHEVMGHHFSELLSLEDSKAEMESGE